MSSCPRLPLVLVLSMLILSPLAAQEQNNNRGETRQGYILWIYPHGDAKPYTVGAYLTYDEAREAEKQWVAQHPNSLDLPSIKEGQVTVSRKSLTQNKPTEPAEATSTQRGTTIVQPKLSVVDPGAPKAVALAGRKGGGTIGNYKVTITFTGDGDKGEFAVAGGLQGRGVWKQLGPYVLMETETSKYAGKLQADDLYGTRQRKSDGTKEDWAISLLPMTDETTSLPIQYVVEMRWKVASAPFTDWHWNSSLHGSKHNFASRDDANAKIAELQRFYRTSRGYTYEFRIREGE